MRRKYLYLAGIVSVLAYVFADILGHLIVSDYNFISNAVSELSESGSDNRLLFSCILVSSSLMGVIFGLQIISNHRFKNNKLIFLGGIFLTIMSLCTTLTATIFPMDPVGEEATFPGIMHLVLVGVSVLLIFPAVIVMGIGIKKKLKCIWFCNYSFITVVILLISGGMSPIIIANWDEYMGLIERVNVYTYFLWISILTIILFNGYRTDHPK